MILYHYSVDSYKEGDHLINDFKKQYRFAEPFLLALRQGKDIFKATYFATMYMGRELVDLNLRKYENYQKDAVEAIFEYVREKEFPTMPSRLNCVFYTKSKDEAIELIKDDCLADGLFTKEQIKLLEVEVDESRIQAYDQEFYNRAEEEIQKLHFDEVFELARKYYAIERTESPLIEIVADGANQILSELAY